MGRFADRKSIWFDPRPWAFLVATLTWAILMLRQLPCRGGVEAANTLVLLCHSDIPVLYTNSGLGAGGVPYITVPFDLPPLTGWFVTACSLLAGLLGASASTDPAAAAAGAEVFFAVTAVALFGCFLLTVRSYLRLGRDSDNGVRDSWDALLIAAAPPVLLSGLINWELLPTALVSVALLAWVNRRSGAAGALLGLAISAKLFPIAVLVALAALAFRKKRFQDLGALLVGTAAAWWVVNAPIMLVSYQRWAEYWTKLMATGPETGSLWYLMKLWGLEFRTVAWLSAWLILIGGAVIVGWALRSQSAPRIGQLAFLLTALIVLVNPMYAPQHAIWLWPLLVLARPRKPDLIAFTIVETAYFLAVWAHLGGPLSPTSYGPHQLYQVALLAHVGVLLWICVRVIQDVRHPWRDGLRIPMIGDPIAGPLADEDPAAVEPSEDDELGLFAHVRARPED